MRLLRDKGNAGTALHLQRAIVGLVKATEDFEHARFACAVAANQLHALLGFQRKVGVVEQCNVPKCELSVKERDKCCLLYTTRCV